MLKGGLLGFGLGIILGAPLVAPIVIYLIERNYRLEGLQEWARRDRSTP